MEGMRPEKPFLFLLLSTAVLFAFDRCSQGGSQTDTKVGADSPGVGPQCAGHTGWPRIGFSHDNFACGGVVGAGGG